MAPLAIKPVATGTVERGSNEVSKAVKDILAAQPETIVQIGSYKACATFIRMARQAGYAGTFYNISFVGTQALMDELGAMARGVVVSQVMPYPYSAATPLAGEYLTAMQVAGLRAPPSYSAIEGFVAAKVFVEVVRRAGKGLSRESFLSAIQEMQNFNLNGLTLTFGPQRNTGSTFVEMTMLTDDGKVRK
jgi:ABC-type branched-subunit amino acid transport system substrate-binding protein